MLRQGYVSDDISLSQQYAFFFSIFRGTKSIDKRVVRFISLFGMIKTYFHVYRISDKFRINI